MLYDPDISPLDLAARLARGDVLTVLDVREPWEFETVHIAGSTSLPLSDLARGAESLDRDVEYIALCHHGMRSEMAAGWMRQHGFTRVRNLVGGIDAYSVHVDVSLPRY